MSSGAAAPVVSELSRRLRAFVIERYPFASVPAAEALETVASTGALDAAAIDALREPFGAELRRRLEAGHVPAGETTPGVTAPRRATRPPSTR